MTRLCSCGNSLPRGNARFCTRCLFTKPISEPRRAEIVEAVEISKRRIEAKRRRAHFAVIHGGES